MQRTSVNTKWLVKMIIFLVVLTGLGVWGLLDAIVFYPARGEASALWLKYQYLEAADQSGDLLQASVDDPRAEMSRLRSRRDELTRQAEGDSLAARRARTQVKRLQWLEALSAIGALNPERATILQPRDELNTLSSELANATPPKPLAAWDIPMQWVFVVIGFGGALWLGWLMLRVMRTRYEYDPEQRSLALPTGRTITPDDLVELDKRKWDKFIVTLRLKEGAPVRLDLLRYTPLEEWVLEMERAAGLADEPEVSDSKNADPAADAESAAAESRVISE